jgi:hypothetical protein
MSLNDLLKKYAEIAVNKYPNGYACDWCGTNKKPVASLYDYWICPACGGPSRPILGYIFGIPIFEIQDYIDLEIKYGMP